MRPMLYRHILSLGLGFTVLVIVALAPTSALALDCSDPANFQANGHICVSTPNNGFQVVTPLIEVSGQIKPKNNMLIFTIDRCHGLTCEDVVPPPERIVVTQDDLTPVAVEVPEGETDPDIASFGPLTFTLPAVGNYTLKFSAGFINAFGLPDPSPSVVQIKGKRLAPPTGQFGLVQVRVNPGAEEIPFVAGEEPGQVVINGGNSISGTQLLLCFETASDDVGEAVAITGTNTFVDLTYDSDEDGIPDALDSPEADVVQRSFSIFSRTSSRYTPPDGEGAVALCPSNEYLLEMTLRDGQNSIVLDVSTPAGEETLSVAPFVNNIARPDLCIRYLDDDGHDLGDLNGKTLNAKKADGSILDAVTLDVTYGACDAEGDLAPAEDCEGSSSVDQKKVCQGDCNLCMRLNNSFHGTPNNGFQPSWRSFHKSEISGKTHYRTKIQSPDLRYPVTVTTFKVKDPIERSHEFTQSIGYGEVHSFFDEEGTLQLNAASNSLGGFFPAKWIMQELGPVLNTAMNSKKFKEEMFLTLFQPKKPNSQEVATCPGIIDDGKVIRGLSMYDPQLGDFEISTLALEYARDGNGNIIKDANGDPVGELWIRLEISQLSAYVEIFALEFDQDSDVTPEIKEFVHDYTDDGVDNPVKYGRVIGGDIIPDPDFGIGIIPLQLDVDAGFTANLAIRITKDSDNITVTKIGNIIDKSGYTHPLINLKSTDGRPYSFNCSQGWSRTQFYQPNNPACNKEGLPPEVKGWCGQWVFKDTCQSVDNLDKKLNAKGFVNIGDLIEGTPQQAKNVGRQLVEQISAIVTCNTPLQLDAQLAQFADFEENPLLKFELPMFGQNFVTDIYADLLKADLSLAPDGVRFQGGGLAFTAGAHPEGEDVSETSGITFMKALPEEFRHPNFGFLREVGAVNEDPLYVPKLAGSLKRELNLVLSEDMINLVLHNVNTTLVDLVNDPVANAQDFLDANRKIVLEKFEMGVRETVVDEDGSSEQVCIQLVDGAEVTIPVSEAEKCFPVELNINGFLQVSDLDGDGVKDGDTPIRLRLRLNPDVALTAKLLWSSAELGVINNEITYPPFVFMALEIDLAKVGMDIYADSVSKTNPKIRSWCEFYPAADPIACAEGGAPLPIVQAQIAGKATVIVQASTVPNGDNKFQATGGVAHQITSSEVAEVGEDGTPTGRIQIQEVIGIDPKLSFLKATLIRNNTPLENFNVAEKFVVLLGTTLGQATFGAASIPINIELPTQLPEDFDGCDPEGAAAAEDEEEDMFALLEDFGFEGVKLMHPLFKIDAGQKRHLGIGFDLTIEPCEVSE
jgi:hypothetical protein